MIKFARKLKMVREARRLTQAELSQKTGLHQTAISHFETGGREPCLANLRRLAVALRVTSDDLIGIGQTKAPTQYHGCAAGPFHG